MSMSYEEAAADAARVISPEQREATALHEQAFQLRKAEREKRQKEQEQREREQRVPKVNGQFIQAREANWQQHAEFIYDCIQKWWTRNYVTDQEGLLEALGQVVADMRQETRELVAKRTADLATREQADKTSGKINERMAALERELAATKNELATVKAELQSARDMAGQFRSLEQGLAARQVDARFAELERALDARQAARQKTALSQDELLEKIARLEHRIADLEKLAAQPGPQGPPGPPGKLPLAREYVPERVHYEADVVTHAGALWQASGDTVHAPPHSDWICLARAGRDGLTPIVRGTYDAYGKYKRLDIVALDGAAFIARRDDPGVCPGDHWQMISRQGRPGRPGETGKRGAHGEKGERGEPGATVVSWQLDRQRYRVSPLMSDGTVGPMLELRGLFEQFLSETS